MLWGTQANETEGWRGDRMHKELWYKHDALSLDLHPSQKPGTAVCICNPSAGDRNRWIPGAHWPASLARLSEKPVSKNTVQRLKKIPHAWAGEMAQKLRALVALPEVLSSIPSNHMVAHSHLY